MHIFIQKPDRVTQIGIVTWIVIHFVHLSCALKFFFFSFHICRHLLSAMASRDDKTYFIITEKPPYSFLRLGSICFKKEDQNSIRKLPKDMVPVTCIENRLSYDFPFNFLHTLTRQNSEFLLALENPEERLKEIDKPELLEQASELTVGSEVTVEQNGKWLKGVVRYIGPLSSSVLDPILVGVFFGVELQVSSS